MPRDGWMDYPALSILRHTVQIGIYHQSQCYNGILITNKYWLVVYLPLWKICESQLGWWNSQYMEKKMFQTTNQYINNQQIFGRVSKSGINWKRAIYPSIPQEIMFSCWPHFGGSMLNLAGVMMDRLLGIFFLNDVKQACWYMIIMISTHFKVYCFESTLF